MADKPSRIDHPAAAVTSAGGKTPTIPESSITIILGRMANEGGGKEAASARGQGTKLAEYLGPESGPFDCGHCEHFKDGGLCDQPVVVKDPDLRKKKGLAVVEAKGCCRYFESLGAHEEEKED